MAARTFSTPSISTQALQSVHKPQYLCFQTLIQGPNSLNFQNPWLGTTKLLIHYSNLSPSLPKTRRIMSTISFSLPTANPDRVSSTEKVPEWSAKAIKAFGLGILESRKLRYITTGSEAFLMGILQEGTSLASKILRAEGITLFKVREEIVKLLGSPELYIFPPERPPLTEVAQRALDWAIDEKLKSGGDGEITTSHMLLGVWYVEEGVGHKVLANLGFNSEKANELQSLLSKTQLSDD